ncbi:MAG: polymerase ECF-type sigma factor [Flaviaesturariibacter sp.]|nr:polymerase ECF-type sigma factor [Flaviaesturariibacter sp.]
MHQEHHAMVLQMCLGFMKGDRELAKDLAQEVFINVWNALPSFKGGSTPKTWIYRITVNTCLLYIRSINRKQVIPIEADNYTDAFERAGHEEEQHLALYKAIGELPKLERLVIMLVLDGVKYEEIEKVTGINSINLRVKIHRIKKKMRQLLKQD